jgi:hypothetical protein
MKRKKCIWHLIIFCAICMLMIPTVVLADNQDVQYTIQKGDTLWTISSGKLKDPLLWPKLWEANKNVHNPHLIYPDQVIVIPGELLKGRYKAGKKLVPAKTIASRNLPTGAKGPIVSRETLFESGYFSRSFVPVGKIESRFPDEKNLFGNGDIVHINTATRLIPDTKFYIGDVAEAIYNPVGEKEIVGYLVRIKGVLQITGEENGNIMGLITENYKEIHTGDVIMSYFPFTPPYEPVIERKPQVSGTIVAIGYKQIHSGKNNVVYINKGSMQGIEIGDKFSISAGKPPHAIIGSLQVFSVFDEAAVAIIIKSIHEVRAGDTFGN